MWVFGLAVVDVSATVVGEGDDYAVGGADVVPEYGACFAGWAFGPVPAEVGVGVPSCATVSTRAVSCGGFDEGE